MAALSRRLRPCVVLALGLPFAAGFLRLPFRFVCVLCEVPEFTKVIPCCARGVYVRTVGLRADFSGVASVFMQLAEFLGARVQSWLYIGLHSLTLLKKFTSYLTHRATCSCASLGAVWPSQSAGCQKEEIKLLQEEACSEA